MFRSLFVFNPARIAHMSRRRRHDGDYRDRTPAATHWIWAVILAFIFGGVYYSFQNADPARFDSILGGVATSMVITSTTSTTSIVSILLGVPVPKADRDQQFELKLPDKLLKQQTVEAGWRIDSWKPAGTLRVIPASPDGKAAMLTDGDDWNVALRSQNGETYNDPTVIGKADATHVFVVASTNVRALLLVSRAGEIRALASMPEFANVLPTQDGHVWLATYTPGEGIESEPSGPSRLIRISVSGIQETFAEETRVITSVLPGENSAFAYRTDDGDMVASKEGKRWTGNGVPLAWLNGTDLLISQGRSVFKLTFPVMSLELLQNLPAAAMAARVL